MPTIGAQEAPLTPTGPQDWTPLGHSHAPDAGQVTSLSLVLQPKVGIIPSLEPLSGDPGKQSRDK